MKNLEMIDDIKYLKDAVAESVKENICEILNLNKTNEKNLDVNINVANGIEVRSFGYKFLSVSKDIDDSTKYNSRFFYRPLRITEDTTDQQIKKYNNFLKFLTTLKSKSNFDNIKEMITSNLISMDCEIDIISQAADY